MNPTTAQRNVPTKNHIKPLAVIGTALVLSSAGFINSSPFHRQAPKPTAPVADQLKLQSQSKQLSQTHLERPIVFSTSGNVSVSLPNFAGMLSVVFSGRVNGYRAGNFHLTVTGIPQPTGNLQLHYSSFDLRVGKSVDFEGHATSFDSTAIVIIARSDTGLIYRGKISTNVDAVSHTFSGKVLLRPVS